MLLPELLDAETVNVWVPAPATVTRAGEAQRLAGRPSSEHVMVVALPVTVQATVAVVPGASPCESVMRGGFAVTVQVAVARPEPPAEDTDTTKCAHPG